MKPVKMPLVLKNTSHITETIDDIWTAETAYAEDDRVVNGDTAYLCLIAHTSGASFAADVAYWAEYTPAVSVENGLYVDGNDTAYSVFVPTTEGIRFRTLEIICDSDTKANVTVTLEASFDAENAVSYGDFSKTIADDAIHIFDLPDIGAPFYRFKVTGNATNVRTVVTSMTLFEVR